MTTSASSRPFEQISQSIQKLSPNRNQLSHFLLLHAKQVLTQLRMTDLKLGLLITFGEAHLKNGIKRIINGKLEDETSSEISL